MPVIKRPPVIVACCLLIDTDICKIPGYPLLKCQKVVADRFSEEVD
ncbi:hypothetical protein AVEN_52213-1, partial [Araneus ventricosus]